jgi:hypothetical protein
MIEELNKDVDRGVEKLKNELVVLLTAYENLFTVLVHKKTDLPIEYTIEIIVTRHSDEDDYGILLDIFAPDKTEENFAITFDLYRANGPILKTMTLPVDNTLQGPTLDNIFLEFKEELIRVLKAKYFN